MTVQCNERELSQLLQQLLQTYKENTSPISQHHADIVRQVLEKVNNHNHASAYVNKLVMYLQARRALFNITFSPAQEKIINELGEKCKRTDLNFLYLSPIYSSSQFYQI